MTLLSSNLLALWQYGTAVSEKTLYRAQLDRAMVQKTMSMCTSILCLYWCKIPVYRLMQTSTLAFHLFPTGDSGNNKGWWCFICTDMCEVPPASLTTALHCLHTAMSASIRMSLFHSHRLKCFPRSDLPLVFGTRVYSMSCVSAMLMRSSFLSGNFGFFRCAFGK